MQSDGRKVEVDDSKGQFVSEYFRTSCPSYYKRDYYDKMFSDSRQMLRTSTL